jgi:hypothetical protein
MLQHPDMARPEKLDQHSDLDRDATATMTTPFYPVVLSGRRTRVMPTPLLLADASGSRNLWYNMRAHDRCNFLLEVPFSSRRMWEET